MAKKFLYFIAFCVVLVLFALLALRIWTKEFAELAFVPSRPFVAQAALKESAYDDPDMWFARPGLKLKGGNPARWQPKTSPDGADGAQAAAAEPGAALSPAPDDKGYALFFVHPTSYLSRARWNAPVFDPEANARAKLFISAMASPFAGARDIWVPRYRQATIGAFFTDEADGKAAIHSAYGDIVQAFRYFLAHSDPDQPIVLAGHSQGALHLMHILQDEVAGKELSGRIAAVYLAGWPVSVAHDLPQTGLPGCGFPAQSGCIMSWSSFAEPAEPDMMLEAYSNSTGLDGAKRGDSVILCTNPLTGVIGGAAPAQINLGTLVPEGDYEDGALVPRLVPARCDKRGLLLIGDPPEMGDAVLPGNNYHVYDIPLFWANIRADVTTRVAAWQQSQ